MGIVHHKFISEKHKIKAIDTDMVHHLWEAIYCINTPTFGEIKTGFYNLQTKVLGLSDQWGRYSTQTAV